MLALVVRFDLIDESAAARFDALVDGMVPEIIAREPGTLVYATHRVDGEPLARVFYEAYVDQAAFAAHEVQPHVQTFLREREQFLAAIDVQFLSVGAAKGVPGVPSHE